MRPRSRYLWVFGGVALAAVLGAVALFWKSVRFASSPAGCDVTILSQAASPDHRWNAVLREQVCSDGAFVTTIVDVLQVVRLQGGEPAHSKGDVLAVDAVGDARKPGFRWLAPRALEVVVPNKSSIGLKKDFFEEVAIHLRFTPDDPKEREQWLEEIRRGPR